MNLRAWRSKQRRNTSWHGGCCSGGAAGLAGGDDEMKNVLNKVLPLMLAFAGLVSTVACPATDSGEGEGE
jgi:hypothetical protein